MSPKDQCGGWGVPVTIVGPQGESRALSVSDTSGGDGEDGPLGPVQWLGGSWRLGVEVLLLPSFVRDFELIL